MLGMSGVRLHFCFILNEIPYANIVDPDWTPRSEASDLDLHCITSSLQVCTACLCPVYGTLDTSGLTKCAAT